MSAQHPPFFGTPIPARPVLVDRLPQLLHMMPTNLVAKETSLCLEAARVAGPHPEDRGAQAATLSSFAGQRSRTDQQFGVVRLPMPAPCHLAQLLTDKVWEFAVFLGRSLIP